MLKPRRSGGGVGVRQYAGQSFDSHTHFLQEHIEGVPCSAVFRAEHDGAILLGATRQLVGTPWLNASGFQYAGSMGPYGSTEADKRWRDIGSALARTFHLRGVFGVDAILRDGTPWPVEINPRYTASIEVLERSFRIPFLIADSSIAAKPQAKSWGKAILFARRTFAFPAQGPWMDVLTGNPDLDALEYADIPHAGEVIEQGRPVLTVFASAPNLADCENRLKEKTQALDRWLWG